MLFKIFLIYVVAARQMKGQITDKGSLVHIIDRGWKQKMDEAGDVRVLTPIKDCSYGSNVHGMASS